VSMRAAESLSQYEETPLLAVSQEGCHMRVAQPKERESFWHCWQLPAKLNRSDAIRIFDQSVKPSSYTYEKFIYDPISGVLKTI